MEHLLKYPHNLENSIKIRQLCMISIRLSSQQAKGVDKVKDIATKNLQVQESESS